MRHFLIALLTLLLSACIVGPNYQRPCSVAPFRYKEVAKRTGWKVAEPRDDFDRGPWWKIFNDPELDFLECQLNHCNQNIVAAIENYKQARALVDAARANLFPTLSYSLNYTRQKTAVTKNTGSFVGNTASTDSSSTNVTTSADRTPFSTESFIVTASWEPDLWGQVCRTIEAAASGAQASAAQIALTRLLMQATLAQSYFQLRTLDADQILLNRTVVDFEKTLQITKNRYAAGVAGRVDVVQAQAQLETIKVQAINNGIARAQSEHAIAVLIGLPPDMVTLTFKPWYQAPPKIPLTLPSELLERRPDIAQAERLMAQANANVGVAIAAYFPTLNLTATGNAIGQASIANFLKNTGLGWAIGPTIAHTFFEGGLRCANVKAAQAVFNSTLATYRQTILSAFQDVEDNLVSLRLLRLEAIEQKVAVYDAKAALKIILNQYKSGTASFSDVIIAQNTAYTAEKNEVDINGLRMAAAVGLMRALGGGWNQCVIANAGCA